MPRLPIAVVIVLAAAATGASAAHAKFRPLIKNVTIDVRGTQTIQLGLGYGWRNLNPTPTSANPCVYREAMGQVLGWHAHVPGRVAYTGPIHIEMRAGKRWREYIPAQGLEKRTYDVLNVPDWTGCGIFDTQGYDQAHSCSGTKPLAASAGIEILPMYGIIGAPEYPFTQSGWNCPGAPYGGNVEAFWDRPPHAGNSIPSKNEVRRQRVIVKRFHEEGCLDARFGFRWWRRGYKRCKISALPPDPADEMNNFDRWYQGSVVFDSVVTYTRR